MVNKHCFNKLNKKVAARLFAATFLAFMLANSLSVLIGFLLPFGKLNAVYTASLLSFALYTAIILWIFHFDNIKKMLISLLTAITMSSIASALLYYLEVS